MVRCACVSLAISHVQSSLDCWHHIHPLANVVPLLENCLQHAHHLMHHPLTSVVRPDQSSHRQPVPTRRAPLNVFITRFLKCEAVSLTNTSGTPKVLHHLSRCFAVDAAVHDSVGPYHAKLLKSSIMTNIY